MNKPFISLSLNQRIDRIKKEFKDLKIRDFHKIEDAQVEFCKTHYQIDLSGLMFTNNGLFCCLSVPDFFEKVDAQLRVKHDFFLNQDLFFFCFSPVPKTQHDKAITYLLRNLNIKYIQQ